MSFTVEIKNISLSTLGVYSYENCGVDRYLARLPNTVKAYVVYHKGILSWCDVPVEELKRIGCLVKDSRKSALYLSKDMFTVQEDL